MFWSTAESVGGSWPCCKPSFLQQQSLRWHLPSLLMGHHFPASRLLLQKLKNELWQAPSPPSPRPKKYPFQTPTASLGRCSPHERLFPHLSEILTYLILTSTLIWVCSLSWARLQNWRLTGTHLPKASEIQGGIGMRNLTNHWHGYFLTKGS